MQDSSGHEVHVPVGWCLIDLRSQRKNVYEVDQELRTRRMQWLAVTEGCRQISLGSFKMRPTSPKQPTSHHKPPGQVSRKGRGPEESAAGFLATAV